MWTFKLLFLSLSLIVSPMVSRAEVWTVGNPTGHPFAGLGVELDPHFLSQNVVRNGGPKMSDWDNIVVNRVKSMNVDRLRVMVLPEWYEPTNDNNNPDSIDFNHFTFDSPEMLSLIAVLDLAQKQKIDVTLVIWGASPNHFLGKPNHGNWVVAPSDIDEWCENISALLSYLITDRGFDCIKELTPINEPDASYITDGHVTTVNEYIKMCKALDARLQLDNLRDKIGLNL